MTKNIDHLQCLLEDENEQIKDGEERRRRKKH